MARGYPLSAIGLTIAVLACAPAPMLASTAFARAPITAPKNPFLAASANPIGHRNSAQQDSSPVRGPEGPTRALAPSDLQWTFVGPGHFGAVLSSPYASGRRVLWSNGSDRIAKLDAETFEVLAELPLGDALRFETASSLAALDAVTSASAEQKPWAAIQFAAKTMGGLAGVYAMIDRDNEFYVGTRSGITAYGDAVAGDPASPIKRLRQWMAPAEISGAFVGLNMTFDGWIILVSENGDVVALSRDFKTSHVIRMHHSDEAPAFTKAVEDAGRVGYGWVRNSYAVDQQGGIFIASSAHLHKVVWTGSRLSVDEADGAWVAPYRNGTQLGSGSTPVLMGFGPSEDHLVVITDGDTVMNVTAFWRDAIPSGWRAPANASSNRVAGFLPANMGNPDIKAIQSEQAVVVAGYGALVVNNQPASIPPGYPARAAGLLVGLLGNDPRFTPHGLQKFQWNPKVKRLEPGWTNKDVASPNTVPFISVGSNLAYTLGARDGRWTLEGLDWSNGKSRFHYVLPNDNYNALFAGLTMDDAGNLIYGSPFGKIKIER